MSSRITRTESGSGGSGSGSSLLQTSTSASPSSSTNTSTSHCEASCSKAAVVSINRPTMALTSSALAAHNSSDNSRQWDLEERRRIVRLQRAARSLGFELPTQSLRRESWELGSWR